MCHQAHELSSDHFSYNCKIQGCSKCGQKHNDLLHYEALQQEIVPESNSGGETGDSQGVLTNVSATFSSQFSRSSYGEVLLSTAVVKVRDSSGRFQLCRALLDSASMSNFISQKMCDQLGLFTQNYDVSVSGILKSEYYKGVKKMRGSIKVNMTCLVISKITDEIPIQCVNEKLFCIPSDVKLADPDFCNPAEVDILIGASVFWNLITSGQIQLGEGLPVLHNTYLGWVVSGEIGGVRSMNKKRGKTICNLSINSEAQNQLAKFWELEELPAEMTAMSADDIFFSALSNSGVSLNDLQYDDTLTYKVGLSLGDKLITKRKILSEISQIFDPLGLICACIIIPKIILQKLWLLNLSWDDLKRVFAFILRFIWNCKNKNRKFGLLTPGELNESEKLLVKIAQSECFSEELNLLRKDGCLKRGCLSNFSPFIDDAGIIRVGGRIQLSQFNYEKKHPIEHPMVVTAKHPLTKLIFVCEHQRLLHSGP
ncbi:hypothetical protein NQ317_017857 [Molorchus minor]|uniref:Peptidase aspartic putative domain-containing protein n=1 Tax=Molorchus minor TaxID=1323400 RepID=A0ABQ9K1L5_9CUCU|nr:hypothetical protein NQ317_017857 [Molorchus minor]